MIILAHDYETTEVDPSLCGVVQSAIAIVDIDIQGNWEIVAEESAFHNPGCPIPPKAAAIHGIHDSDVAHLPHFEMSLAETFEEAFREFRIAAVLGYNSNRFDNIIARRVGLQEGLVEIDMMVAAQRLMNRGVISRARLVDAYEELVGLEAENAHDAMADVRMTLDLIRPVMRHMELESFPDLAGWLGKPEANTDAKMPFGKHKGVPVKAVPKGYLRWLLDKGNLQADLELSIREVLG